MRLCELSYASLKLACHDARHGRLAASGAPGQLKECRAIQSRFKRKLAVGTVVLAAVAFAGGAYAATQQPPGNARQAYLDDVAKRLHVTPAELNSALKGAALDQLSAAVKSGRITQAQANALKQRIEGNGHTPGPLLFGLHALRRHMMFGGGIGIGAKLAPVAKYLSLTNAQLRQQLESGKSLAQIAKAQGKSTSGLEQVLTAAVKQRLDKAVANKRITSAQEQKLLSMFSSRIGDLINRTPPKPGTWPHPGMGRGGFGYGSHGGFVRPGRFMPPAGGPAAVPAAPAPTGPTA